MKDIHSSLPAFRKEPKAKRGRKNLEGRGDTIDFRTASKTFKDEVVEKRRFKSDKWNKFERHQQSLARRRIEFILIRTPGVSDVVG